MTWSFAMKLIGQRIQQMPKYIILDNSLIAPPWYSSYSFLVRSRLEYGTVAALRQGLSTLLLSCTGNWSQSRMASKHVHAFTHNIAVTISYTRVCIIFIHICTYTYIHTYTWACVCVCVFSQSNNYKTSYK